MSGFTLGLFGISVIWGKIYRISGDKIFYLK